MNCYRLITIFILASICNIALAQIRVNVSSPIVPDINFNNKTREFKKQFRQIKKDSLAAIDGRTEELERQIDRLEQSDAMSLDSTAVPVDTSQLSTDSLGKRLSHNEYIKDYLQQELDSLNKLKDQIEWDEVKEQYVANKMRGYFQFKGFLPPPTTNANPVEEFKNSIKPDAPASNLDPDSFQDKKALAEEAAKQLDKLKKKYQKVDDLRHPENAVEKPKPYSTFTDRLIFGGQINVSINKDPTIDLKPNFGFIVSNRVRLLVDYSAHYFMKPKVTFLERDETKEGKVGIFTDVDITRGFFARGKLQKALGMPVETLLDLNCSLGLGKTLTLHKNLKAQIVLSHAFTPNERGKRWYIEYGIQQRGISQLFQKKK